jgi:hypothetical protein
MPPGAYIIATIVHTNQKCTAFFDELEKFKQDHEMIDKVLTAGAAAGSPLVALVGATGQQVANFTSAIAFGSQINQFTADVYAFRTYSDSLKKHVFDGMSSYQKSKGIDLYFERQVGVTSIATRSVKKNGATTVMDSANIGGSGMITLTLPVGSDPKDPDSTIYRTYTVDQGKLDQFANPDAKNGYQQGVNLLIARNIGVEYASLCSLATMRDIIRGALDSSKTTVPPSASGSPATTETVAK